MKEISQADFEAVVQLLSKVGDPSTDEPLLARKQALAEGLARLAGADIFVLTTGMMNLSHNTTDAAATSVIDGGWRDEQERAWAYHHAHTSPGFLTVAKTASDCVRTGQARTYRRQDVVPDDEWAVIGSDLRQMGWAEMMLSMYPLGDGGYTALGLHRRVGSPPFSERDRCLVHIVFENVEWLHRAGLNQDAGRVSLRLTPRERQVLMLLLKGDSRKMIASKIGISLLTVGDHLKRIYRQFDVNSSGELMARFMSGGGTLP